MNKYKYIGIILWVMTQILYAQNSITIGTTMYQNQAFTAKDKQIFDADKEGSRVWRWSKAQNYCKKLKLDGYDDWRVASRKELQGLMTKKPSSTGLFVKSIFASSMPATGRKYDDVWMWTRDSKSSKLGAFVNFKKAKSGWADKKYKGYVICSRSVGKATKSNAGTVKLKRPFLFEYKRKIWRSDMTQKGTKPLGDYSLLYFYCQNGLNAAIPHASKLIKHKKTTYFFAYKGKNKKNLNLYRTNGTLKGTKKIGSIGHNVAYSPIWVGDKLYFLSSEYLPQQDYPAEEKLWVLDSRTNSLKYIGETASRSSSMYPFLQSKTELFFKKGILAEHGGGMHYTDLMVIKHNKKGFRLVKRFKKEVPPHLKYIKITGKKHYLYPLHEVAWGCGADAVKGNFQIEKKSLRYKNKKLMTLSNVKGLNVYDVKLVYNGKTHSIVASNGYLWALDSSGNIKILKRKK